MWQRAFFENASVGMCRRELEGRFLEANPALLRLLGVESLNELHARESELADGPEARTDLCRRILAERSVDGLDMPWRTADGTQRFVRIFATRSGDDDATYDAVVVDLTEVKRRVDAADAAIRAKSVFLANMSHEIRTPLTSIIGFASVLTKELDGEARRHAELIAQSGRRLVETMDGVLTFATLESDGQPLPLSDVDVAAAMRSAVDGFALRAASRGIELRLNGTVDRAIARAEPQALGHILHHLIGNAIKFTDEGRVEVGVRSTDEGVVVEVVDTGVGIDAEFLPHVFDPFKQESSGMARSHEGVGIGLTIAQRLAQRMGATLEVDSLKGEGSRFTLTLPHATIGHSAPAAGTGSDALR